MLFSKLKAKTKSELTEFSYLDYLASFVLGMFEFKNIPVPEYGLRYLRQLMLLEGKAALFYSDYFGRWITGACSFEGMNLDEYGELPDAICFDRAGHESVFKDWKNNDKCFIFFNTREKTRDINIERYADLLAKIDISLNANIVNSRYSPIVLTNDLKTNRQISEAIQSNRDGSTMVITSSFMVNDEPVKVLNITDVNASDKIQYLNHAADDILRRFLNIYGIDIAGTGKMAQQSISEVNGSRNSALVLPLEMKKSIEDTLKRVNEVTGWGASVRFAEIWKREEMQSEAEADIKEAEADKAEKEAEEAEEAEEVKEEEKEEEKEEGGEDEAS